MLVGGRPLYTHQMSYGLGVVVVGDSTVGKTCLIQTYGKGIYPEEYIGTVGHSYTTSLVINGESIEVNVHDTGGSSQHSAVRQQLYFKADVLIICFDLTERKSFLHINQFWLSELKRIRGGDIPFLVVGCKNDLRNPSNSYHVQKKEGLELARALGCHYFECSSITQRNVKEIFDTAVKVAMDLEPRSMSNNSSCSAWLESCFSGARHKT